MIPVYLAEEIKLAERNAMGVYTSEDILIENAGFCVVEAIKRVSLKSLRTRIAVFCGSGNNGADGEAVALQLLLRNFDVTVYRAKGSCGNRARQLAYEKMGGKSLTFDDFRGDENYWLIIDAIYGTGISRKIVAEYSLIERINNSKINVLSIDIPSGLGSDSGEEFGIAVKANQTVTFFGYKYGHLIGRGKNYCGEIIVKNLGVADMCTHAHVVTELDAELSLRQEVSHKGNYGKVAIIGGCETMIGASILSAASADATLRSGAGLVTLVVPRSLARVFQARVKEVTLKFMPDDGGKMLFDKTSLDEIMGKCTVIAIGMGLGVNENIKDIIGYLAAKFSGTLVIDADGINALEGRTDLIKNAVAKIILTPHPLEFERLSSGYTLPEFLPHKVRELAKILNAVILYKAANSIVSDGHEIFFTTSGTPAMAKGGSGDVLSGIVSALACVMDNTRAAYSAAFHFGKCGERASEKYGSTSLLARHIVIEVERY